eukprot:COSAG01_NODE_10134_length_2242_cov_1.208119_3_plen_426_part_01
MNALDRTVEGTLRRALVTANAQEFEQLLGSGLTPSVSGALGAVLRVFEQEKSALDRAAHQREATAALVHSVWKVKQAGHMEADQALSGAKAAGVVSEEVKEARRISKARRRGRRAAMVTADAAQLDTGLGQRDGDATRGEAYSAETQAQVARGDSESDTEAETFSAEAFSSEAATQQRVSPGQRRCPGEAWTAEEAFEHCLAESDNLQHLLGMHLRRAFKQGQGSATQQPEPEPEPAPEQAVGEPAGGHARPRRRPLSRAEARAHARGGGVPGAGLLPRSHSQPTRHSARTLDTAAVHASARQSRSRRRMEEQEQQAAVQRLRCALEAERATARSQAQEVQRLRVMAATTQAAAAAAAAATAARPGHGSSRRRRRRGRVSEMTEGGATAGSDGGGGGGSIARNPAQLMEKRTLFYEAASPRPRLDV